MVPVHILSHASAVSQTGSVWELCYPACTRTWSARG